MVTFSSPPRFLALWPCVHFLSPHTRLYIYAYSISFGCFELRTGGPAGQLPQPVRRQSCHHPEMMGLQKELSELRQGWPPWEGLSQLCPLYNSRTQELPSCGRGFYQEWKHFTLAVQLCEQAAVRHPPPIAPAFLLTSSCFIPLA